MTLTDAEVQKAEKRMQARMQAQPRAVSARYDRARARVVVSLSNGLDLGVLEQRAAAWGRALG